MESKSGYENCESLPMQHVALFLPFIVKELDLKILTNNREVFQLSDNDFAEALQAWKNTEDADERTRNIYVFLMNLFQGPSGVSVAQALAQWFMNEGVHELAKKVTFPQEWVHPAAFEVYQKEMIGDGDHNLVLRIAGMLPVAELAEQYVRSSTCIAYAAIGNEIKNFLSNNPSLLGLWTARCLIIIRTITALSKRHSPANWFRAFLMLLSHHPRTRALARFIDRDYEDAIRKFGDYMLSLEAQKLPTDKLMSEFVSGPPPDTPRPPSEFGERPRFITGEMSNNYELRSYQIELAAKAKMGLSTIVCAPTGSGKTHVAVDIILHHLRDKKASGKVGRVAMFVPTIPLVDQQSDRIFSVLKPEYLVSKMSGAEKVREGVDQSRAAVVLRGDVCVVTPQVFINMLLSPLKSQRIYLNDFTLLVFDECHHCSESHPYNVLMDFVRNAEKKPQIVGLTASVGVGKGKFNRRVDAESAIQHIVELCARLNAVTITSVRNSSNLAQLRKHISQPVDEIFSLRPADRDDFAHIIAGISDHIQENMRAELVELVKILPELTEEQINLPSERCSNCLNGSCKTTVRYNAMLAHLKNQVERKHIEDKEMRLYLLKCITLLEICHFTLRYNELLPAHLAFDYFLARIQEFRDNELFYNQENDTCLEVKLGVLRKIASYIESQDELLRSAVPASITKPILEKLFEVINTQYIRDNNSRILIFVETRKCCAHMADFLNNHPQIINTFGNNKVGHIVSVNQAAIQHGQSSAQQQTTLEKFRRGKVNILIATSVAEEGLDVAECNLIIKYNNVGSEKSYIQRKGRARAKNSRSVLLALNDNTEQQEYLNIMREYLMNICIQSLQAMGESELKAMINEKSAEILKVMEDNKRRIEQSFKNFGEALYGIECIQCCTQICESTEVRSLSESQYICCNQTCWLGTRIERKKQKNYMTNISVMCGEWLCKCGRKRGEVIKYGEAFLPTISADSIRLKQIKAGRASVVDTTKRLTWKVIQNQYFAVFPITVKEIREMISSLYEHNQELFNVANNYEKQTIMEVLQKLNKNNRRHVRLLID